MFASKEVHVAIERWGWGFNNIIKSSLTCNCKFSFIFETISISILLCSVERRTPPDHAQYV